MTRATETLLRIAVIAFPAAPIEFMLWRAESLGGHIDIGELLGQLINNVLLFVIFCGFLAWPFVPVILMIAGISMLFRALDRRNVS